MNELYHILWWCALLCGPVILGLGAVQVFFHSIDEAAVLLAGSVFGAAVGGGITVAVVGKFLEWAGYQPYLPPLSSLLTKGAIATLLGALFFCVVVNDEWRQHGQPPNTSTSQFQATEQATQQTLDELRRRYEAEMQALRQKATTNGKPSGEHKEDA